MKEKQFNELLKSINEGGKILKGEKKASREFSFEEPDAKLIRENLGLSQIKFSKILGISVSTLQNWEQGRRKPTGPAKILLNVAANYPEPFLNLFIIHFRIFMQRDMDLIARIIRINIKKSLLNE